jgi:hypothetical protein
MLRNHSDSTEVTASLVDTGGYELNYTVCSTSFANNAANFDDNDNFVAVMRSSNSEYAYCAGAYLYANLTNLSRAQVHYRAGLNHAALTGAMDRWNNLMRWTPASYSSPTVYFEQTGFCNENINASALGDNSNMSYESTSALTTVTGSTFNWNSSTFARTRSGALTLTGGNNYGVRHLATTSAETVAGGMFIVVNAEGSAPAGDGWSGLTVTRRYV